MSDDDESDGSDYEEEKLSSDLKGVIFDHYSKLQEGNPESARFILSKLNENAHANMSKAKSIEEAHLIAAQHNSLSNALFKEFSEAHNALENNTETKTGSGLNENKEESVIKVDNTETTIKEGGIDTECKKGGKTNCTCSNRYLIRKSDLKKYDYGASLNKTESKLDNNNNADCDECGRALFGINPKTEAKLNKVIRNLNKITLEEHQAQNEKFENIIELKEDD